MAESDHRSYRDPAVARGATTPTRGQPDDPLAGLARLIGESPITNVARGATTPTRDQPDDPLAGLARLIAESPTTNDLPRDARGPTAAGSRSAREFNPPAQHGYAAPTDVLQETSEEQYSTREKGSYDLDPPKPRADVFPQSRSAWYEHEPDAADPHVEASGVGYRDCEEDQSHDHPDDLMLTVMTTTSIQFRVGGMDLSLSPRYSA
jgi:hypothetical protein